MNETKKLSFASYQKKPTVILEPNKPLFIKVKSLFGIFIIFSVRHYTILIRTFFVVAHYLRLLITVRGKI